jgi:aminoglycoside 3-N-acetyltransferase
MSELRAIQHQDLPPVTVSELVGDFRSLGVRDGGVLLVHTSLSKLGWVAGGAQAVIEALLTAVGESGTLAMPCFSTSITEPSYWTNPPVPESWWPVIRAETPAYDPAKTPPRMLGIVAESFRTWPGADRSAHPHDSVCACGPKSAAILHPHSLEASMGEGSPLARLYDHDAQVLLLGVGHGNNSSLHLADHRASYPCKRIVTQGAPLADGWQTYESLDYEADDFEQIGEAFGERATKGKAGRGEALLMSQRELVDFGATWMTANRPRQA